MKRTKILDKSEEIINKKISCFKDFYIACLNNKIQSKELKNHIQAIINYNYYSGFYDGLNYVLER